MSASDDRVFNRQNVVCVITGSSRGFGRQLAFSIASRPLARLCLILTARSADALSHLKSQLQAQHSHLTVQLVVGDLSHQQTLHQLHQRILTCSAQTCDHVLLFHNAGSLFDPRLLLHQLHADRFPDLNQYYALNVTSLICLTSSFLTAFAGVHKKTIVNISSLASVQAMKGLAVYGSGKAARDSLIRSIALENPDVRCLNYAPGPLETDMAQILRSDSHLTDFFQKKENLLTPEVSAEKLMSLLQKDEYENGSHVDYYDV